MLEYFHEKHAIFGPADYRLTHQRLNSSEEGTSSPIAQRGDTIPPIKSSITPGTNTPNLTALDVVSVLNSMISPNNIATESTVSLLLT